VGSTLKNRLVVDVRGRARRRIEPSAVRTLSRRLQRAMRSVGLSEVELSLSLSDDAELHRLNRQYADEDHATDVLSFSQEEGAPVVPAPRRGRRTLGDVVISVETAERQADAGGRTLGAELFHLSVHGLVHLLGYDHATPEEERVMFGYEAKIRKAVLARGRVAAVKRPAPAVASSR
jgi:probable rRNA maturation factor